MLLPFRNFITHVLLQEKNVSCITYKETITCCCYLSAVKSCPILCNPMHCSLPASSVFHCLPKFVQIQVLWVLYLFFKKNNIQKWVKKAKWLLMLREGAIFIKEEVWIGFYFWLITTVEIHPSNHKFLCKLFFL